MLIARYEHCPSLHLKVMLVLRWRESHCAKESEGYFDDCPHFLSRREKRLSNTVPI